ncbi:MAG TPA: hypothetical protein VLB68_04660 [Pyrinomonadaceae bacterium]|nr:hypothetical protein [Pyrinomonadaceae bacterium]
MTYVRQNKKNVAGSILVMMVLTSIAAWQFYRFVTFADTTGAPSKQGGLGHLLWAMAMLACACIVGFLISSVFLRRDADETMHINSYNAATGLRKAE